MQIPKTSLWARRLALYFSLCAGVIVISHVVFSYFGFLHIDVDSTRYMLSALIQSEAAIVALVVTLSLVAVQLAAQSYSARVIDVFRRTPDLWILMGIYGIAIFYGLGVLKLIENVNPAVNSLSNLEQHIVFSYYLGVFAFVALVPYILKLLKMLEPSTIINMMAEGITKQSILSTQKSDEALILPLIDIVHSSLMKCDYETAKEGLRVIRDRVDIIFRNETFKESCINKKYVFLSETSEGKKHYIDVDLSKKFDPFFTRLGRIGILSASKNDEDSTREVIVTLKDIAIVAVKKNLEEATVNALDALREVGMASAEHKLNYATLKVVNALEEIIGIITDPDLKSCINSFYVIPAIEHIKERADEEKLDDYWLSSINEILGRLEKFAIE
jgi:hypothetical protein